jgi:hypothetical protein
MLSGSAGPLRGARPTVVLGIALLGVLSAMRADVDAQVAQGAPPPPAVVQPARTAAPIDLTGVWASHVTEDWQWRFVTPIVGDYTGVPMNSVADKLARTWDPAADVKAGEQCRGFGAAAINRLPTRLRISWQDDQTLKLEWDLGTQTRLVHFDKTRPAGAPSFQGHAIGEWIDVPAPGGRGGGGGGGAAGGGGRGGAAAQPTPAAGAAPAGAAAPAAGRGGRGGAPGPRAGGLKIVTTNLKFQYLRQNGVPISEKAVITEYLDVVPAPDGGQWLVLKTQVDDPTYLSGWYIVSSNFRKEADASKWNPTPCELLPRLKGTATQVPRQGGD